MREALFHAPFSFKSYWPLGLLMVRTCSLGLLLCFLWIRPVYAEALYLECRYEQCAGPQVCTLPSPLVINFLFDTLFHKAYRLEAPTARPVKQTESPDGIRTLLDKRSDGSVYLTTIMAKGYSVHSEHSFKKTRGSTSVKPVFRQYYGNCHPVSRNAMSVDENYREKRHG
jgi:hypothetical protein